MELAASSYVDTTSIFDTISKGGYEAIIPKTIFLYEFTRDTKLFDQYLKGKYSCKELHLKQSDPYFNFDFLWLNYIEHVSDPTNYTIKEYVDDKGNSYSIVVEAISRRKKFKDGSLPIAYCQPNILGYADIFEDLELPECFRGE